LPRQIDPLISAPRVARITGVSHQHPASGVICNNSSIPGCGHPVIKLIKGQGWWCTPVIPATQMAEVGGSQSEATQKFRYLKNT
jgi:hypothetical protein